MTISTEIPEAVLEGAACELAFRAGHCFERLLIDRAIAAKRRGEEEVVVSVEDVEACIDPSLVDDVRAAIGVAAHGAGGKRRLSA